MLDLYRTMRLIRETEERILTLFSQGRLVGTTHTCIGQEANAVGIIAHLTAADIIFSNHRCHGHYIAYTGDVRGLIAELMGRPSGVCGGQSGSQHLCSGNFHSNGVQGGIVPNAVGMALAERERRSGAMTVVFLGDGTLGEGVVYESMNIAALWSVPILFVIENNYYAQSTPSHLQIAGEIAARPRAFGIETVEITSTDAEEIRTVSGSVIAGIRESLRPACLVVNTYRLAPHSKGDDNRDPAEIEAARLRDPLVVAEARLVESGVAREAIAAVADECHALVDAAVTAAWAEVPSAPHSAVEAAR